MFTHRNKRTISLLWCAETSSRIWLNSVVTLQTPMVFDIRECESIKLISPAIVSQAEVLAITEFVSAMIRRTYNSKRIRIIVSSQTALRTLGSITAALCVLGTHNSVIMGLVRGHYRVEGYGRSYLIAKRGAKESLIVPKPTGLHGWKSEKFWKKEINFTGWASTNYENHK